MPSRTDLERLVVWCDPSATEVPSQLLRAELGAALTAHRMTPSGDVSGLAAFWKGRISLRASSGISEFPAERVRFEGTLAGVRNPAKTVRLVLAAGGDFLTVALTGDSVPGGGDQRFDALHATDSEGVVRVDWTSTHRFELALWPDLGVGVDIGPP